VQQAVHADQRDRARALAERVGDADDQQPGQQDRPGPEPPGGQRPERRRDRHRGQRQASRPEHTGQGVRSGGGEL
jgi:hypothetical protein